MFHTLMQRLRSRKQESPQSEIEQGPLYAVVRDALVEVQAYARTHGGRIELISVNQDGDVTVKFEGACKGCPVADLTFKHGIELQLKQLVPGVRSVKKA
jgi:Fe-S cluster biogenesis protein NfuA